MELLKRSEGFRGWAYRDSSGFLTIGYGHKLVGIESYPEGIDERMAVQILMVDVRRAEQAVERLAKVGLTQGQFDALTDFCFNLGAGRLASSTLLKALNRGQFEEARQQFLLWDQAHGEVNAGLRARREAEFALWGSSQSGAQTAA